MNVSQNVPYKYNSAGKRDAGTLQKRWKYKI